MRKDKLLFNIKLPTLAQNIISTLLRQVSSVVIGLGLSIFLARTLGPEGNGIYTLAILLPTLLTNFLNLGIAPANVYFISRGDISVRNAFQTNLWIGYLLALLGIIAGTLTILLFSNALFPGVPSLILWIALLTFPVNLIQSFLVSLLQGIQDFKRFNGLLIFVPIANILFIIIAIWGFNLDILGALIGYALAQGFGLYLTICTLRPYLSQNNVSVPLYKYAKKSINYGWKAHLSNILAFINYRLDIFLVNLFLNPIATGIYVIAVQIAERLWIVSGAVSTVILPRLSELHNNENSRRSLTPLIARWVLLITFISALIIAFTSKFFIRILFGEAYLEASTALLLLLPGIICGSFSRIFANDLAARGRPELNMYTALIIVAINTIANIILIPRFGINGAAVATTLSYASNTITKLYLYSKISQNSWWKSLFINQDDLILIKGILRK